MAFFDDTGSSETTISHLGSMLSLVYSITIFVICNRTGTSPNICASFTGTMTPVFIDEFCANVSRNTDDGLMAYVGFSVLTFASSLFRYSSSLSSAASV